jgi:hypothetical protein
MSTKISDTQIVRVQAAKAVSQAIVKHPKFVNAKAKIVVYGVPSSSEGKVVKKMVSYAVSNMAAAVECANQILPVGVTPVIRTFTPELGEGIFIQNDRCEGFYQLTAKGCKIVTSSNLKPKS